MANILICYNSDLPKSHSTKFLQPKVSTLKVPGLDKNVKVSANILVNQNEMM